MYDNKRNAFNVIIDVFSTKSIDAEVQANDLDFIIMVSN